MKILFIDQKFDAKTSGGAFKSSHGIINDLVKNPDYEIKVLARDTKEFKKGGLIVKRINPILRTSFKKINSIIKFLRINQYLSLFPIIKQIKKNKPNVIIVQRDLTFAAMVAGFLKKIPVINIIRDPMGLCPKFIDIIDGFNNCSEVLTRKKCWECINRWRTLRVILLDKPVSFHSSLTSQLYTIYYKILYYIIKIQFFLMKYVYVNVVASPLMKDLALKRIKNERILVRKITPIDNSGINITNEMIDKKIIEQIEKSNKIILYIIPRNEGGSKGYPFVRLLLDKLPKDYIILVIGTFLDGLKKYPNVINFGKIPTNNLYYLYQKARLTIVPSIYTEAFGRVILESIMNNTPVIASPQCGANYLFKKKKYLKILPLKVNLWIEEIEDFFKKPVEIPEEDIKKIERMFSPKECANQIIELINKL
ncbi:MAG: glycosyltransferase [Candidatus Thorarchaeota archaeon]